MALACPQCGAPPGINPASARIVVTSNSENSPRIQLPVGKVLSAASALAQRFNLSRGDVALGMGAVAVIAGVFAPLIRRPATGLLLTYSEHSRLSAGVLLILALLAILGRLFQHRGVTAISGLAIVGVCSTALLRLNEAFDALVHPSMNLHIGAVMIMAGGALIFLVPLIQRSARTVENRKQRSQNTDSELKRLFSAWLQQQGLSQETGLDDLQRNYERFMRLYRAGELDLIGLRRIVEARKG